jgi:hypothetical protein
LISRDIFINFTARERAAASGKALILIKDRAFIRPSANKSSLKLASARPDQQAISVAFPPFLPPDPYRLTPLSNFAGAPLRRRCGPQVEYPVYLDRLPLALPGSLMACSPSEALR